MPEAHGVKLREAVLSGPHVYWLHIVVREDGVEFAVLRRTRVPGGRCRARGPVEQHAALLPPGTRHLAVGGERAYVTSPAGVTELEELRFVPS